MDRALPDHEHPPVNAAGDLVAVADERVDLEVGEAVEVGADRCHFRLEHRMKRVGILLQRHDPRDRHEVKAVLVAEVLPLQLPDAVPKDVGGADRLCQEAERRVAEDLERLAGIADEHAGERAAADLLEPAEGADPEVVVDAAVGERLGRKVAGADAEVGRGDFDRGEKAGERARRPDHLGDRRGQAGNVMEGIVAVEVALLDVESVAVEDGEHPIADVRGEDVKAGALRQLEQPAVAVEKIPVVAFQERVGGEMGGGPTGEPGGVAEGKEERQSAHNVIADVELNEANHLGGSLGELRIAAVVAIPVEDEVGSDDAAAGDSGDVGHEGKRAAVTKVANHPEVVERGPETTTGESQTDRGHGGGRSGAGRA